VTAKRLERLAGRIGCELVIAGDDPDLTGGFDPDLRGTGRQGSM
jgi:hypothetical protein